MKSFLLAFFLFLTLSEIAVAETVVAARTIRSRTILAASDVALIESNTPGAITRTSDVVGLEARVVLYEGRPIKNSDIGPAAIVERNQIVSLVYSQGALSISTEARALGRGGVGDLLRVINLVSRNTVTGTVAANGTVVVRATPDFKSN